MKQKLQGLVAGLLISTFLTGGVVFAKQGWETISVAFDNIKIMIDGKEYQPTDADGNAVEPFIYEGTTYLPVRAIANAFDKNVDWEPQTSTITLGSKNYDWLDQMGYVDYETTGVYNSLSAIPADTITSDGKKHSRGIHFYFIDEVNRGSRENENGTFDCYQSISYLLNGNYKTFEGEVSYMEQSSAASQIKIYGDEKLIYASPTLSGGMHTTPFNISVDNIKVLKIHVEFINPCGRLNGWGERSYPCITDARLSKK